MGILVDGGVLRARLRAELAQAELEAARRREFIPDGVAARPEVLEALRAAVASGVAVGLERAVAVLDELAGE